MLTLCEHLGSPPFLGGSVYAHRVSFLRCVVFLSFVCLRPVSCVHNVAGVSGLFILYCLTYTYSVTIYQDLKFRTDMFCL